MKNTFILYTSYNGDEEKKKEEKCFCNGFSNIYYFIVDKYSTKYKIPHLKGLQQ